MKLFRTLLSTAITLFAAAIVTGLSAMPVSAAGCATPNPNFGVVTQTATVDTLGTYYIWSRMKVPSTAAAAYLLDVDGANCYTVGGGTSLALNSWVWVNFQSGITTNRISKSLTVGSHTLKYIGNADGVGLDKILLVLDANCTPTGLGDNCLATTVTPPPPGNPPPPVPPGTPPPPTGCVGSGCGTTGGGTGGGGTVGGTINVGTVTGVTATSTTKIKIDGKTVNSTTIDSRALTNGQHTVEVTTVGKDGTPATVKTTLDVNNDLNWYEQIRNFILKPLAGSSTSTLNTLFAGISIGAIVLIMGLGSGVKLLLMPH